MVRIFLNSYCDNWLFYQIEFLALQCFTPFLINCFSESNPTEKSHAAEIFLHSDHELL